MKSRLAVLALFAYALLSGCSVGGAPRATVPGEFSANRSIEPRTTLYGIGLSGYVSEEVPKGLSATKYLKTFCQTGKKIGCPIFTLGQRNYHVSIKHSLPWSGGTFSALATGTSKLGLLEVGQHITSTSKASHVNQGVQTETSQTWIDHLTITSGSMPYGTPAKFKVTTTISPTTADVPCNGYADVSISFFFSSVGLPNGYSRLYGGCVGKKFEFYLNGPSHPGTSIVETMQGTVGQTLDIQVQSLLTSSLCDVTACIRQSSAVDATIGTKIEPMTPGITFKTASGERYD